MSLGPLPSIPERKRVTPRQGVEKLEKNSSEWVTALNVCLCRCSRK
nr:MAG TPA: hypothetical protein [Caudoviricetes sp.]